MEKPGRSENLPSSPWAARFPLDLYSFISQNTNHSTLAPFPRIDDPRYYDQEPEFEEEDIPTKHEDIDKILWSEMVQAYAMHGRETWQTAVLSRYLQFSPTSGFISGGHRPIATRVADLSVSGILPPPQSIYFVGLQTGLTAIKTNEERDFQTYQRERIQVNENNWLPFLQKNRWFDWIQVSPPFEMAGRTWSVDEPIIWDFLRVVLELVNRILLALIEDKHEGVLSISPAEWKSRLITLLQGLVWTFADSFPADAVTTRLPCVGNQQYIFPSIISIGVRVPETVLDSKLTLAELCSLQVESALILVHELMHAIITARYLHDHYIGNRVDLQRSGAHIPEPFLDAQGIAETGHYMDQLFWGGVINSDPGGAAKRGAPPLGLCFTEWPWAGYGQKPSVPESAFLEMGAIVTNHHVPLTWVSRMLSESFWQDPEYPKKSANFFHRNFIFVSESPNDVNGPATYNPPQVRDLDLLPVKYPGDTMLVEDWDERQRLWDQFRDPWYRDAKNEWLLSPWSNMAERQDFFEFEDAFAKKNIVACATVAEKLVNVIPWYQGINTFLQDMPSRPRVRAHRLWAWHTIGLLMMASIPIQRMRLWRLTGLNEYLTEHVPSREAAAVGFQETVYLQKTLDYDKQVQAGPSKFFDIRGDPGDANAITQLDYIQRVDDIITLITTHGLPVHERFITAITTAKDAILAERQKLAATYLGTAHANRWTSSWLFKLPAYDPAYVSFNQDDNTWHSIESHELDN
ncbi:hypothetical protein F5B21DRAFT_521543 [Xylaria acuta]|nr:hypothetical protein F5B21DRAFT_521543 [Xylaria acuta]